MYLYDIRKNIALELDEQALINYCTINKQNLEMCSDKRFWRSIFDKYNLPFHDLNFLEATDYIDEFLRVKKSYDNMTYIMDNIINGGNMVIETKDGRVKYKKFSKLFNSMHIDISDYRGGAALGYTLQHPSKSIVAGVFVGKSKRGKFYIDLYINTDQYNPFEINFMVTEKQLREFIYNAFYNDLLEPLL